MVINTRIRTSVRVAHPERRVAESKDSDEAISRGPSLRLLRAKMLALTN